MRVLKQHLLPEKACVLHYSIRYFLNESSLQQTKITAPSMSQALAKVKETLGKDAIIVATEEHQGQVTLTAAVEDNRCMTPRLRAIETPRTEINERATYPNPLAAIKAVCDICDEHQLGYGFCEQWLKELSSDFIVSPVGITRSLSAIVPFCPYWLDEASPKQPIILVGPQGSGKTVTIAKIAAILLSQKRKVKVLTLDTIKAGGVSQLQSYLDSMKQPLLVGEQKLAEVLMRCKDPRSDEFVLIDTPGLNVMKEEDQSFLYHFFQEVNSPLTLVLAADMNPIDAEEVARNYYFFNTQTLIATRFDATKHYGGLLSAAHTCGLQIAAYSDSPSIGDGLHSLTAEKMIDYLLFK